MIAVHKDNLNNIIGFRLLDTDSSIIRDATYESVYAAILEKKTDIENLKIENGKLVGSNGILSRFPVIKGRNLSGLSPLIILFEMENNYYKVTNYLGEIVDISEEEAIRYAETEGIANGKIVTEENGNKHISSINGPYKKDKISLDKKYGEVLIAKRKMFKKNDFGIDGNYMAYAIDTEIERIVLTRGILGLRDNAFKGCKKLKYIELPLTIEKLGIASLAETAIETIKIPEGIKEIPDRCFEGCKQLKTVCLPNSLLKVNKRAFYGCDKLKTIYKGPNKLEVVYGAIPFGVVQKSNKLYKEA